MLANKKILKKYVHILWDWKLKKKIMFQIDLNILTIKKQLQSIFYEHFIFIFIFIFIIIIIIIYMIVKKILLKFK